MKAKDILGRRGEDLAAEYLQEQGLVVLDRNWRCSRGELDIVATDGEMLIVAEVKTRSSLAYGHPFEAITAVKLHRLQQLAHRWSREHHARFQGWRIDAIAVIDGCGRPTIEHLKAVG